ncbi:MAG: spermidine/putrescine ABC transporter substrate-binding protein, partial [Lachnospiraceae bacterium]|nr:spermidine/putrescine ABC transporter substrate-binding protein [Lachnospiraceae bacterium]
MKRKSLLIFALCASLIFGLAACGGSGGSGGGSRGENGSITVFNYGDYIDRDLISQFESEYGITVNYEEYVAPEDMYTKYTSGAIDYDVIITSDYM